MTDMPRFNPRHHLAADDATFAPDDTSTQVDLDAQGMLPASVDASAAINAPDHENSFVQTNLVSDGFVPAAHIDTNLVNPWGIAFGANGPFWIADNGTGLTTFYNGAGVSQTVQGQSSITIAVPPGQTSAASPTGEVRNNTGAGFDISSGGNTGSSVFLFATEDGTISGWNPNVNKASTILAVDNSAGGNGAVYKGLTMGTDAAGTFLYAANFRSGMVEVYDQNFKEVNAFTDPRLTPNGYAPFDVQVLNGHLFVTFALQNSLKHDDVAGPGHGFVDEFSLSGQFERRVASGGVLNSPWGLAIAPSDFGKFSNDLLVGNFGDGAINVFDPKTDHFLGQLRDSTGAVIHIDGLWSLIAGNSGDGRDPNAIYFTAGVGDEQHGLFGSLTETPEPGGAATSAGPSQAFANMVQSMSSFGATSSAAISGASQNADLSSQGVLAANAIHSSG